MSFVLESDIVFLEHVVLVFSMHFLNVDKKSYRYYDSDGGRSDYVRVWPQRGTVQLSLTSPSGTTSTLLPLRRGDAFPGSYHRWPLMSVHFWGEDPEGTWTVIVANTGTVGEIRVDIPSLTLYGTSTVPEAVSRIPSQCSSECDPTRGCAGTGAEFCDACAGLRIASTLECTSSCPEGLSERNGYCYNSSQGERACEIFPPTPTPSTNAPPSITPTTTVPLPFQSDTEYPTPTSAPPTATSVPTTPTSDHTPGKRSAAVQCKWNSIFVLLTNIIAFRVYTLLSSW